MEDRLEHLIAANHSRDVLCDIEIAMKNDGSILGIRAQVYGDMGGYIRTHGSLVPASTAGLLMGPYADSPIFPITTRTTESEPSSPALRPVEIGLGDFVQEIADIEIAEIIHQESVPRAPEGV